MQSQRQPSPVQPEVMLNLPPRTPVFTPASRQVAANSTLLHALRNFGTLWPSGVVPYEVDNATFYNHPEMIENIDFAVREMNQKANVRFAKRDKTSHSDYVTFKYNSQSNGLSAIGRQGGNQIIWLNHANDRPGTILHEMMHCLGFLHDDSRHNTKSRFIAVINTRQSHTFQHDSDLPYVILGAYDGDSVMQHHCNERPATAAAMFDVSQRMGQREGLSQGDLRSIKFLYGPPCCTFDFYGTEMFPQAYMECITCWGDNSCFGACLHCADAHHRGHQLVFHSLKDGVASALEGFVCDCGRHRHRNQMCTSLSTQRRPCKQSKFLCLDCFSIGDPSRRARNIPIPGVCLNCARKCHQGHDVRFEGYSNLFCCDCGQDACQIPCKSK